MNKFRCLLVFLSASSACALSVIAQTAPAASASAPADTVAVPPPPAARTSPHETISMHIGSGSMAPLVTITYGRPYSKDPKNPTTIRKIWGTLVPWDKVWRMGSDEATTLITQQPLDIGGTTVPAGAYTLCMFPVEQGPTKLIVNKQIGQWGIPYLAAVQANELARIDMKKDTLNKQVDEFTIALVADKATGGGVLKAFWETTQYSVPFALAK